MLTSCYRHFFTLILVLVAPTLYAQTNWDQIYQQNDEISRRIDEQNRQQNEANENYRRQQEEEARQQEQNQSQPENIQYEAPRTQPGWTQSYGAVVMTDAHSDAWAAVNFTSQFLADESALRACREMTAQDDKAECKVAMDVSNGAIALSRAGDGSLRTDWGANSAEAMEKNAAGCQQANIDCVPIRVYESLAWWGSAFPSNFMAVTSPKNDAKLLNKYAVAVWANGNDMWSKSAWVSSGSTSFIDTEASAMALCKKDTGTDCVRASWVSNGHLVIGQDDNGALRASVAATLERARERIQQRCETDNRTCTLIDSFDARQVRSARVELPRPWIGISFDAVTEVLASQIGLPSPRGALITEITSGGPAAAAGLQVGDVILSFAGNPVSQSLDLAPIIARAKIGVAIELDIIHFGKPSVLNVTPRLFAN